MTSRGNHLVNKIAWFLSKRGIILQEGEDIANLQSRELVAFGSLAHFHNENECWIESKCKENIKILIQKEY